MATPLRLLLIEDCQRDAEMVVRAVRQGGYDVAYERVDSAGTLAAALDAASWDLAIADYSMPGFNSPAALRLIRERALDLPFIIVSGTIRQEVAVRMMREGARDFLSKDDLTRLLPAITRELQEAAERRARRAAEEALQSSEERFRLLFAANPQPMWVYDRETLGFLEVNDAALAQYGYSRDEFLAMQVTDIHPLDGVPAPGEQAAGVPSRERLWQHRLKDGRLIDVEIAVHALQFAGRAAGLIVATDVTERMRQQEARARLAALVDSSEDAIIGKSLEGIIESWNAGATRLYGYSAAEAIGRHIGMLAPPDRACEVTLLLGRLARGESISHFDTVRVRKDGTQVVVSLSLSPIRTGAGRIIGASTIARDVGDHLRAQQAVEQARAQAEELARLRADFVTSVSHELRTPLTSIVGYVELLRGRWLDIPESRRFEYIERVAVAAKRQVRLVEDLLLVSRLEAEVLAPQCEAVELSTVLRHVARETQGSYPGQRIGLEGPRALAVRADPLRVTQIMANLVDNAAKYSPEGSPVFVSWRREGDRVAVRVRDQGSGISDRGQAVLFTRFGRVPESRIRSGHVGTGLGLFLARRLAQAMGGDLDLEATGPEGSTFTLWLPLMPDGTPSAPPAAAGTDAVPPEEDGLCWDAAVEREMQADGVPYGAQPFRQLAGADPAEAIV